MLPWKQNTLIYHQRLIIWRDLNWPDSLFHLSPSHFPLKNHTLSQVSQQNIELLPSASDSRGVILLFKSGLLNKNHTEIYTERTALVQILPGSIGGSFLTAPFLVKRGWAGSRQSFCALVRSQPASRSSEWQRWLVRAGQASAACGQLTPPPLTQEFTVFLNSQSNIENFLDGTFEAVEIVVDKS